MEVTLTIHTVKGAREVPLTGMRLTLGRTDEADVVISDSSLSHVHASINREADQVWIVDEGSTNGTSVNNEPVPLSGSALKDRDEIYIGNTTIVVNFRVDNPPEEVADITEQHTAPQRSRFPMPIIATAGGLLILLAVIVAALAYRNSSSEKITVKRNGASNDNETTTVSSSNANQSSSPLSSETSVSTVETNSSSTDSTIAPAKRYLAMSSDDQKQFIANEAQHVARMIGNREGYAFTPEVVAKIKIWVDAYAHRLNSPKPSGGGCNMHHDLTTLVTRARMYAPVVVRSFNEKGLSPQVGLYLAMIEAEYCPCLSSGTGPKGYFQFASSTARRYGVQDVSSPKDTRPDDRCKIEIMAPIAAQYMKDLIAMFGTGPLSVPLAVASYNSGEGGLNENLMKALNAARTSDNPERSFWTMVAHEEMLSDQFQRENIKYVPHFFGAAIVGENPRVFGVDSLPISAYAEQRQTNPPGTQ